MKELIVLTTDLTKIPKGITEKAVVVVIVPNEDPEITAGKILDAINVELATRGTPVLMTAPTTRKRSHNVFLAMSIAYAAMIPTKTSGQIEMPNDESSDSLKEIIRHIKFDPIFDMKSMNNFIGNQPFWKNLPGHRPHARRHHETRRPKIFSKLGANVERRTIQ
ncbi:MAG: hypothetical protein WCW14_00215 [Candidatus Paceibacterota bacterium]